jgi:hypothetical protein
VRAPGGAAAPADRRLLIARTLTQEAAGADRDDARRGAAAGIGEALQARLRPGRRRGHRGGQGRRGAGAGAGTRAALARFHRRGTRRWRGCTGQARPFVLSLALTGRGAP